MTEVQWKKMVKILDIIRNDPESSYNNDDIMLVEDMIIQMLPDRNDYYSKYYNLMYPERDELELTLGMTNNTIRIKRVKKEVIRKLYRDFHTGKSEYVGYETGIHRELGSYCAFKEKNGNEIIYRKEKE